MGGTGGRGRRKGQVEKVHGRDRCVREQAVEVNRKSWWEGKVKKLLRGMVGRHKQV